MRRRSGVRGTYIIWLVSQKCNGARRSPRSGRKSKAHGASRGYRLRALGQPAKRAKDPSPRRRFLGSQKGSLCGRRQSMQPLRAAHRQRTPWASLFRPLRGLHHRNALPPTACAMGFHLSPASRARPHSGSRPRPSCRTATHERRSGAGHESTPSLAAMRWSPSSARGRMH
jgi:hypothetical protein